jgi:uroporphyrinogen decarboxylase
MTSKERVRAAMYFQKPDKVPVQYYYPPVGYYEHGEKLNDLYAEMEGDFGPFKRIEIPVLTGENFDGEGNYHTFQRDKWGTFWEFRIFGIAGIPYEYPLADAAKIENFKAPEPYFIVGPVSAPREKNLVSKNNTFYQLDNGGSLYERLISLRPEADVLCDIVSEEPYINVLADKILEFDSLLVKEAIESGADGIFFGDDYGTGRGLMMSPELWRSFFYPRLESLFRPARAAGLDIHFHCCGNVWDLLSDFAKLGVTSLWPQLPVYNMQNLANRCRELGLAVAVHTDRARTMTFGSPQDIKDLVLREYETFKLYDGGGWFYIEADNGFPWANLEALVRAIKEIRNE